MTDLSNLEQLRARVMEAKGAMTVQEVGECILIAPWPAESPTYGSILALFGQALHGSVDAAIAFINRVLPGWKFSIHGTLEAAQVLIHESKKGPYADAKKADSGALVLPIPLALLAAALSALIEKEKAGE